MSILLKYIAIRAVVFVGQYFTVTEVRLDWNVGRNMPTRVI